MKYIGEKERESFRRESGDENPGSWENSQSLGRTWWRKAHHFFGRKSWTRFRVGESIE